MASATRALSGIPLHHRLKRLQAARKITRDIHCLADPVLGIVRQCAIWEPGQLLPESRDGFLVAALLQQIERLVVCHLFFGVAIASC